MKFDRAFLITLNVLARLFGALFILVGIVFLVSAYLFRENRILDIVIGLWVTAMGTAFLLTKSLSAEQLVRIRLRLGRPGS
jgi:multisubunit Na+/H+ antiporter MnhC subunit